MMMRCKVLYAHAFMPRLLRAHSARLRLAAALSDRAAEAGISAQMFRRLVPPPPNRPLSILSVGEINIIEMCCNVTGSTSVVSHKYPRAKAKRCKLPFIPSDRWHRVDHPNNTPWIFPCFNVNSALYSYLIRHYGSNLPFFLYVWHAVLMPCLTWLPTSRPSGPQ